MSLCNILVIMAIRRAWSPIIGAQMFLVKETTTNMQVPLKHRSHIHSRWNFKIIWDFHVVFLWIVALWSLNSHSNIFLCWHSSDWSCLHDMRYKRQRHNIKKVSECILQKGNLYHVFSKLWRSQEKNPFELGGENQSFELFKYKYKNTLQGKNYSVPN